MVALSCVLSLNTGFTLFHPSISEDEIRIRLVREFHSLFPYAYEFWVQHLVHYVQSPTSQKRHLETLFNHLQGLVKAKRTLGTAENRILKASSVTKDEETLINALENHSEVHDLVREILMFRNLMKNDVDVQDTLSGRHIFHELNLRNTRWYWLSEPGDRSLMLCIPLRFQQARICCAKKPRLSVLLRLALALNETSKADHKEI